MHLVRVGETGQDQHLGPAGMPIHECRHCNLPDGVSDSDTQNRDSKAVHLKLDELIRAVGGARNHMVDLERLSDQELRKLQDEFARIGKKADAAKALIEQVQDGIAAG